jgi:1-acyl-sn-glycerol-3-phosphate acyltransferase
MWILKRIYAIWGLICFAIPFLWMFPIFYWCSLKPSRHKYAAWLNKIWANVFYAGIFVPYRIEYQFKPLKNQPYVYCANHTSLLDIVTMGLVVKGNHTFVGKAELAKIPLFGPMYEKLHIPFNRESKIGSYKALLRSKEAIEQGKSVIIFPEGGIYGNHAPTLNPFKDGPFRLAIEKQVPIVPVTILYNWIIFADDDKYLANWHLGKAIVHPVIETAGMTVADMESLKNQTFTIINEELKKYFPKKFTNESKSTNFA